MLDTYGADALRLYMINSPVVRADDLRFSEEGVKQCLRDVLIPWWNAYSFLVTYARIDGWTPRGGRPHAGTPSPHLLDRWILSALERLNQRGGRRRWTTTICRKAVRPFVHFIDDLTKWYIRRSRRRFWKSQTTPTSSRPMPRSTRAAAPGQIAAPFTPFIAEESTQPAHCRTAGVGASVRLPAMPTPAARPGSGGADG
jgi:isoleucyl-tRNA synthetase